MISENVTKNNPEFSHAPRAKTNEDIETYFFFSKNRNYPAISFGNIRNCSG